MTTTAKAIQNVIEKLQFLRNPETGCPWSIAQTFESLTKHTLEETYELIDALERGDSGEIMDELGDMLYQFLYYTQIATENQLFTLEDICENLLNKIDTRYSGIDKDGKTPEEVNNAWVEYKLKNKPKDQSLLSGTSSNLPALVRAAKIQEKATRCGFDWQNAAQITTKLDEELEELKTEIREGSQDNIQEEFGDVLYTMVNLSRHLLIDAETALRLATKKFMIRFEIMEKELSSQQKILSDLSLDELEKLWEEAKSKAGDQQLN